ncbi:hypothetical protein H8959_018365 [Pygathrix nigripes]
MCVHPALGNRNAGLTPGGWICGTLGKGLPDATSQGQALEKTTQADCRAPEAPEWPCLPACHTPASAPLLPHPVPGTPQAAEWGADITPGPKAREARLQQCTPAPPHPQQLGEPPQASRDGCQA